MRMHFGMKAKRFPLGYDNFRMATLGLFFDPFCCRRGHLRFFTHCHCLLHRRLVALWQSYLPNPPLRSALSHSTNSPKPNLSANRRTRQHLLNDPVLTLPYLQSFSGQARSGRKVCATAAAQLTACISPSCCPQLTNQSHDSRSIAFGHVSSGSGPCLLERTLLSAYRLLLASVLERILCQLFLDVIRHHSSYSAF